MLQCLLQQGQIKTPTPHLTHGRAPKGLLQQRLRHAFGTGGIPQGVRIGRHHRGETVFGALEQSIGGIAKWQTGGAGLQWRSRAREYVMRRWNGWGDDATSMNLGEGARAMLAARLGPGLPGRMRCARTCWRASRRRACPSTR